LSDTLALSLNVLERLGVALHAPTQGIIVCARIDSFRRRRKGLAGENSGQPRSGNSTRTRAGIGRAPGAADRPQGRRIYAKGNYGFVYHRYQGAEIADPEGLLHGTGKFMRHVKLWPERDVDATTLMKLIETAYTDMKARLKAE